uniref:Reverse transcriptase domain-containing protein n=1 Tax=Tanacetum cinerariifolium TaxID=118510 RepID=A0A699H5W7_TANCI|nr:reverse transcriptase domain-containing protein [Tanacetum cinerariifolium]
MAPSVGPGIPIYPKKKTKKGTVDSQPIEEGTRGTEARDVGKETLMGPTEPVSQIQKTSSPSSAFIIENINVLRTMIKEHDQQAKKKATPKRIAYVDSDKEAPIGSLAMSFSDRFSLESSRTFDTRIQTRFADKSQRTPSKNKEPSHRRRSRRLEDRSRTKEKVGRSKSRGKRVYEGNKDSEDHLSIFSAAAEQEERSMPVWCKMFRQTLGGVARNWFDDLDPKSVDSFEELSQKFLEELSQQKRYAKDPTEIYSIKRKQNKGLQAFMDRFKSKSSNINRVPSVLRISAFMHGHGHPKLAKKLNDKIPKTVEEMLERFRAFIRGEVVAGSAEMIEKAVASGKLAHLVKDIRQNNQRNGSHGRNNVKVINIVRGGRNHKRPFEGERSGLTDEFTFLAIPQNRLTEEPIILKGMIEDHQVRRILVDSESSRNIPPFGDNRPSSNYERGRKKQNDVDGVRDCKMSFAYNVIIGRTEMKSLGAVGSTIHSMIKFPTNQGIVTMETSREALWECNSWKRCKVYRKRDMYPFLEEGEGLASLMEYPYKCFLRIPKDNSQIRMAENDEEKTRVEEGRFLGHVVTKEGVRVDPEKVHTIIRSPTPKEEAKGSVVKKFFGKGEQVQETPDASEGETSKLSKNLQAKLTPNTKGLEVIPEKRSNRRRFERRDNPRLIAYVSKGMKDLHILIDSLTLVSQIEGNHTPVTEQERKSVNKVGDCKAGIPQLRSFSRNQDKTINRSGKSSTQGASEKA